VGARPFGVLSVCSGGGGLDLGLHGAFERLGIASRMVAYVEREAYACAVLAARMEEGSLPPAPIWSDITTFDASRVRGAVDVVIGGFPCQPHSVAGAQRGVEDERWIWPDIVRIVRDSGASVVFFENVRGLLNSSKGEAFHQVLADLARLGLDAEWCCVRASDVGAPHRRERVFILGTQGQSGHAHVGDESELADAGSDGLQGSVSAGGPTPGERRRSAVEGANVVDPDRRDDPRREPDPRRGEVWGNAPPWAGGGHGARSVGPVPFPPAPGDSDGWRLYLHAFPGLAPATQSKIRRGAHGVADRLGAADTDELRLLGNGVVPQQASAAFLSLWERLVGGAS
jgi:DNA (cytosine-5)-methyltransferase 1